MPYQYTPSPITKLATMGFVGYVMIDNNTPIRATSCDMKLTQAIEKPEIITGKYDRQVYKLGPREAGGSIAFPAVMEVGNAAFMEKIWELAASRTTEYGRLKTFDATVKYTSEATSTALFKGCSVNTFKWGVTQGDIVNVTMDVWAQDRSILGQPAPSPTYLTPNVRAVTWADVNIAIDGPVTFDTAEDYMRSFEFNINNNLTRIYAIGDLAARDIAPKVREINGNMVLIGRNDVLGTLAESNIDRCSEDTKITFTYGALKCANFTQAVRGVVLQIETMALTNDLVESTIEWHALPGGMAGSDLSLGWT